MPEDWFPDLDDRPAVICIAGSNGAGKSTFFESHLSQTGLRFVNADELALQLNLGAYEAAELADRVRRQLLASEESFIFETVFSDPVGAKIDFLQEAEGQGYQVIFIFIEIADLEISKERVSIRVAQGGHDVPDEKLEDRFARTRKNLERAISNLPLVIVFENSDLACPYQLKAVYQNGSQVQ